MIAMLFLFIGVALNLTLQSGGIKMNMWQFWAVIGYLLISVIITALTMKGGVE